jgi:hypothetical protein
MADFAFTTTWKSAPAADTGGPFIISLIQYTWPAPRSRRELVPQGPDESGGDQQVA